MFHPQRQCRLHHFHHHRQMWVRKLVKHAALALSLSLMSVPLLLVDDWLLEQSFHFSIFSCTEESMFSSKSQVKKHKQILTFQLVA